MKRPGPYRVGSAALVAAGLAIALVNFEAPDESRTGGLALLVLGGWLVATRETAGKRRVIETLLVLLLVLVGGELGVRRENARAQREYGEGLIRFVDDPWLRYELLPGRQVAGGRTNALGMVDRERTIQKPEGMLRIACLGDSVGADRTVTNACEALEPLLRDARSERSVEVLNFSVPGYSTMQEARSLERKALPMSPDAVVVLYVMNDAYPDLAISHFLPGHFKFEHLLYAGGRMAIGRFLGPVDPFGGLLEQLYDEPRAWRDVVVAGFARIRNVADEHELPVVVAVFPLFLPGLSPRHRPLYDRVLTEAERNGFVAVDLATVAFGGRSLEELLKPSRDFIHPNDLAHRLAAEAIARSLRHARPELFAPSPSRGSQP